LLAVITADPVSSAAMSPIVRGKVVATLGSYQVTSKRCHRSRAGASHDHQAIITTQPPEQGAAILVSLCRSAKQDQGLPSALNGWSLDV
jgi:hypothetical protein